MVFVLLCVDVVLEEDLNSVVHFSVDVLAQDAADDRDALFTVSFQPFEGGFKMIHTPKLRDASVVTLL